MAAEDVEKTQTFVWKSKRFHLTYKTHVDYEEFMAMVGDAIGANELKAYSFVHENADEKDPYEHTHFAFWLKKQPNWKGANKFDFKGIHCNVKPVITDEHWENVVEYHRKAPVGDSLHQDLCNEAAFHDEVTRWIHQQTSFGSCLRRTDAVGVYISQRMTWAKTVWMTRPKDSDASEFPLRWPKLKLEKATILWGASGLGKTEYALGHFERPLLINDADDLKDVVWDDYDGVVFDDMSFLHWPREAQIHFVNVGKNRTVRCRYFNAALARGVKMVFTTNNINGAIFLKDAAIKRRVSVYQVIPGFGPQPSELGDFEGALQ